MSGLAGNSSGRVPQGEVVVDFADGGSYIKQKLETAVLDLERRRIQKEEGKKAQLAMQALEVSKAGSGVKREDVDFIIGQLGCKRDDAEGALKSENGDLVKALIKLVQPKPRAKSVDGG